ncbi:MAG: leucine-rich repeat domain-containing protein, partial [Muribaculaceae bacterium]|nr:leucine-rich repeat domain-containing protein [Muribaculaceae bacterium]
FSDGLLMNATNLTEIEGVPAIVPDLFAANCRSFGATEAVNPASRIGAFAFAGTRTITIALGSELTGVSEGAFAGCHELEEIDARALAGFTPAVELSAFDGIEITRVKLVVQDDCEDTWKHHPVWGLFDVVRASMTDIDGIADDVLASPAICVGVADAMLTATASEPGVVMAVYDTAGNRVALLTSESDCTAIALSELPRGVLLVNATSRAGASRRIKVMN